MCAIILIEDNTKIGEIDIMDRIKEQIEHLRREIERYNYFYYVRNESLISDYEYDQMLEKLNKLEEEHPQYRAESSPTERVGSSLKDTKFQKVVHKKPMLSLSNTYNIGEVQAFMERVEKAVPGRFLDYVLELKLDGLSISIQYENGVLTKGVTRGDGEIGEDVTENILQIESIPKYLKKDITVEVRGEIILPLSNFEKLNKEREAKGEELFANPRNAASGTLRQLDSSIVRERGLDAHFYFVVDGEDLGIKKHSDSIKFLEELGLKTTGVIEIISDIRVMDERIKYWETHRENLDYETDGMVIKLNETDLWEEVGYTSKSPRWAIAFKYPPKQVTTNLLGITWQVGRTGKVTPVAELEEVEVSGSRVKRASLHNYDEILRKDIRVGDRVFIEKAAEIIPQVVMSVKEVRKGTEEEITAPEFCPVCGTKLVKEEGLVDLKCPNHSCPAQVQGKIEYFVSRDAMNITGLGSKVIEKLLDLEFINDASDIYDLWERKDELEKLEKMGKKSVENLLNSIEVSKEREYAKTLYALGIPYVGKVMASTLAKASGNIDELAAMRSEELVEIEGVGEKVAQAVWEYFRNESNKEFIEKLKAHGVKFAYEKEEKSENIEKSLTGKTFLVTGTLIKHKRSEIQEMIEANGGQNLSGVSKKLNYLIVGEDAGSKLEKAQKLGTVTILTEDEFLAMIK